MIGREFLQPGKTLTKEVYYVNNGNRFRGGHSGGHSRCRVRDYVGRKETAGTGRDGKTMIVR